MGQSSGQSTMDDWDGMNRWDWPSGHLGQSSGQSTMDDWDGMNRWDWNKQRTHGTVQWTIL